MTSKRAFKVAKNDNRVQLKTDSMEMNMSLWYNLRAQNYDFNNSDSPPADSRSAVHPIAWRETVDDKSGDDMSILILIADSDNEDSEIELSESSDD